LLHDIFYLYFIEIAMNSSHIIRHC
jgi:hypothetical protein